MTKAILILTVVTVLLIMSPSSLLWFSGGLALGLFTRRDLISRKGAL